jgi:hypothetical protein
LLSVIMLSAIMLSIIMLSIIMLSVIILSVIMLSVSMLSVGHCSTNRAQLYLQNKFETNLLFLAGSLRLGQSERPKNSVSHFFFFF